jgi:hypothetical protein
MNKKLLVSVLLCFFVFSLGIIAQKEERMIARQERERMKIQAAMAEPGAIIYVDDATGDDEKGDGTEKKPYKTIGRALEVAESEDTIKVGPGDYYESFWIQTLDYITLEGSGRDSTTIDGHVWVDYCKEFRISGFKIKGDPVDQIGIWCWNIDYARIVDCIIDCPYDEAAGIIAEHTYLSVNDSTIRNTGAAGWGVHANQSSTVALNHCTIERNGCGVVAGNNANVLIYNCDIIESDFCGVQVQQNAHLCLWGGMGTSINSNTRGIMVDRGGVFTEYGSDNQIFGNTEAGIYLRPGGQARLGNINIEGSPIGIKATQASILDMCHLCAPIITNNDVGVEVSEFAHAFLGDLSINGNGLDVSIHTGGQAICNPDNIGTIVSECKFCPSKPI